MRSFADHTYTLTGTTILELDYPGQVTCEIETWI